MANPIKIIKGIKATKKAVQKTVKENIKDRASVYGPEWMSHPGAASTKSNKKLAQGKFSSPKQISKYQKQEAKAEVKANKRGLKAANKPVSKNNRNRLGDGEMSAYLKSIKPARPNRTRGGNLSGK